MTALLDLLQLADSAFPTGAFAHSLGLESLAQDGLLHEGAAPEALLDELLRARVAVELARVDLPLLLQAHAHAASAGVAALAALNQTALAARPVREWRVAAGRTGRALLATVVEFLPDPLLATLLQQFADAGHGIQLPVAFGAAAQRLGCPAPESAHAFAYNAAAGQLAATVRLGLIGSRAAQRILHRLKPALAIAVSSAIELPEAEIGGSLPLVEIAGMRHECAPARLFAS